MRNIILAKNRWRRTFVFSLATLLTLKTVEVNIIVKYYEGMVRASVSASLPMLACWLLMCLTN